MITPYSSNSTVLPVRQRRVYSTLFDGLGGHKESGGKDASNRKTWDAEERARAVAYWYACSTRMFDVDVPVMHVRQMDHGLGD